MYDTLTGVRRVPQKSITRSKIFQKRSSEPQNL